MRTRCVVGLGYHDDLQTRAVFMEVLTRILQQVYWNYSFTLPLIFRFDDDLKILEPYFHNRATKSWNHTRGKARWGNLFIVCMRSKIPLLTGFQSLSKLKEWPYERGR